jgi:hypothetical protein
VREAMECNLEDLVSELNEIKRKKQEKIQQIESKMKSLPVDENLLFFYGESCPFTARARPEIQCLEIALGKQITKKEVWNDKRNEELYQSVGGQKSCGGVPFFYNQTTGKSVCGARACDILLSWANSQEKTDEILKASRPKV